MDTTVQKAEIPKFSGCLEHTSMIWHQIQLAKREKTVLRVIFLDLASAFGCVPHRLYWAAFNFIRVAEHISYFQDLQFCFAMPYSTTTWQSLEIGIMAGCTNFPLAFTMTMKVIIRASKWVVGGKRLKSRVWLMNIRAHMDDMMTLTTTASCTRHLLGKLQESITWAKMKVNPSKSRSIFNHQRSQKFFINDEPVATVSEKPVISLGRWYDTSLRDHEQVRELRQDIGRGLENINQQAEALVPAVWPAALLDVATNCIRHPPHKSEMMSKMISS